MRRNDLGDWLLLAAVVTMVAVAVLFVGAIATGSL